MTHEEEYEDIKQVILVLEAEYASNVEELVKLGFSTATSYEVKRECYLNVRNAYIQHELKKLKQKRHDKEEVIAWEKRTS